jgi:AcrR family transcriptional regulator
MARRSDHSREEIRRLALDAAEQIVVGEGFKGLSTRKVATAIGYTVGTLYHLFANLDDLVLQVNGRTLDDLYSWVEARHSAAASARDRLLALANAYIAYAENKTPRWNMLFEYVASADNQLPEWYMQKLARLFAPAETALQPLAGEHSEPALQQAARVLWASVHGICTLKIRHRMDLAGGQSTEQMAQMLIDNFLRGFQQPSTGEG